MNAMEIGISRSDAACTYQRSSFAWCAKTPQLGNGPLDVPGDKHDVHYAFGPSPNAAIGKLLSKTARRGAEPPRSMS
jgi:hypothetical protein